MTFRFLLYGIERVSVTKKGIFWYYIPNLLLSFFFSLFITLEMDYLLQDSAEWDKLLNNFNPSLFKFLEIIFPVFPWSIKNLLIIFSPLYIITYLFLSGGAIKILSREWRSYDFKDFLNGCYGFFPRFFQLFIISIPFYLTPYFAIKNYIIPHFRRIYIAEEVKLIIAESLIYIFSFFLFAIFNLIFDITKIRIVAKDSGSVMAELFYSILYLWRNFLPAFSLYLYTAFLNAVPLGLYILISSFFLFSSSLSSILLSFLIFQLILLIRIWIKFVFWASQRELWLYFETREFR